MILRVRFAKILDLVGQASFLDRICFRPPRFDEVHPEKIGVVVEMPYSVRVRADCFFADTTAANQFWKLMKDEVCLRERPELSQLRDVVPLGHATNTRDAHFMGLVLGIENSMGNTHKSIVSREQEEVAPIMSIDAALLLESINRVTDNLYLLSVHK